MPDKMLKTIITTGEDRLFGAVSKMYVCLTNESCPPCLSQCGTKKKCSGVAFFKE